MFDGLTRLVRRKLSHLSGASKGHRLNVNRWANNITISNFSTLSALYLLNHLRIHLSIDDAFVKIEAPANLLEFIAH